MKKVIFILAGIFPAVLGFSQSNSAGSKVLTVEQANKLNGIAQPTINGIPYSQFKAQQQQNKVVPVQNTSASASIATSLQKPTSTAKTPVSTPVQMASVNSTNTGSKVAPAENKELLSKYPSQSVAATTTTAQPVEVKQPVDVTSNATNAESIITKLGGTPVPAGSVNAPAITTTSAVSTLPAAKLDNSKPVQIEEVPKSVVNPALKVPVVPMQTDKKG